MAQILQWTIAIFEYETRLEVEPIVYFATNDWMLNRRLLQVTVSVTVWLEAHELSLQIEVQIILLLQAEGTVLDAGVPPEL